MPTGPSAGPGVLPSCGSVGSTVGTRRRPGPGAGRTFRCRPGSPCRRDLGRIFRHFAAFTNTGTTVPADAGQPCKPGVTRVQTA